MATPGLTPFRCGLEQCGFRNHITVPTSAHIATDDGINSSKRDGQSLDKVGEAKEMRGKYGLHGGAASSNNSAMLGASQPLQQEVPRDEFAKALDAVMKELQVSLTTLLESARCSVPDRKIGNVAGSTPKLGASIEEETFTEIAPKDVKETPAHQNGGDHMILCALGASTDVTPAGEGVTSIGQWCASQGVVTSTSQTSEAAHQPSNMQELRSEKTCKLQELSQSISCLAADLHGEGMEHAPSIWDLRSVVCGRALEVELQHIRKGWKKIVTSKGADCIFGCLVMLNTIAIFVETQFLGMRFGQKHDIIAGDFFTRNSRLGFKIMECAFLSVFTVEILLRIVALKCAYFAVPGNFVDLAVVVSGVIDFSVTMVSKRGTRLLRILVLLRLARVVRMCRIILMFDSFVILIRSLRASVGALVWSLFFLFIIISASAVFICQTTLYLLDREVVNLDPIILAQIYSRFGTFSRAMISMCEVVIGNWGPPCWLLVNHVSEWFEIYFLVFKCIVGFAILNVINAVFLQQTMKAANNLDEFMISQNVKSREKYAANIDKLFEVIDTSGDGFLSIEEFKLVLESSHVQSWLQLLGIQAHEAQHLFDLLDDGDGRIHRGEFLKGILNIAGNATHADFLQIQYLVTMLTRRVDILQSKFSATTDQKSGL